MSDTTDMEGRVAALEANYQHLATKADLAEVKGELSKDIAHIDGQLETLTWVIPLVVAVVTFLIQYFGPRRPSSA